MAVDYEMLWRGALQNVFLTEQRVCVCHIAAATCKLIDVVVCEM